MQFLQNAETVGLFPIPVTKFSYNCPEDLIRILKNLEMINKGTGNTYDHLRSKNTYVLDIESLSELRGAIEIRLAEYMKGVMSFEYPGQLTQSWVLKSMPGESHHQHVHPNSIISGVYYFDLPNGSSKIRFHKSVHSASYLMEPMVNQEAAKNNFYAFDWIDIEVFNGDIIMFPSYLEHSVPINNSDRERWSMAFNSVSSYALGSKSQLTELMIRNTYSDGIE